jgi:hypothetical protein
VEFDRRGISTIVHLVWFIVIFLLQWNR